MTRRLLLPLLVFATLGWMSLLMLIAAWENPRTPSGGLDLDPNVIAILAHAVLFGVLGALVLCDVLCWRGRHVIVACIAASLVGLIWGTATELYQIRVPGRDASLMDVVNDILGAASGGMLAAAALWAIRLPWATPKPPTVLGPPGVRDSTDQGVVGE